MSGNTDGPAIASVGELLAHVYQMELEAEERYTHLAEQMEVHNNTELGALFRKLAHVEGQHAKEILEQMRSMNVSQIDETEGKWAGDEPPESVDLGDVSYMMTPRAALMLALEAERRALRFFDRLKAMTDDEEVRRFASEFAEEEQEHVDLVLTELNKYPESSSPSRDDMDPPIAQG